MKKLFFAVSLLCATYAQAAEYTGKSTISWMSSIVDDHFVMSGDWGNTMNCSNMNQKIWKIYSESGFMDDLQSMYSMAMAAYLSGKTVELYSHACDGGSTNGRPMARSIYLPSRDGGQ